MNGRLSLDSARNRYVVSGRLASLSTTAILGRLSPVSSGRANPESLTHGCRFGNPYPVTCQKWQLLSTVQNNASKPFG